MNLTYNAITETITCDDMELCFATKFISVARALAQMERNGDLPSAIVAIYNMLDCYADTYGYEMTVTGVRGIGFAEFTFVDCATTEPESIVCPICEVTSYNDCYHM